MSTISKNTLFFTCLLLIIITGIILRLYNLSSFRIYPDSYQSIIVAENLRIYHSVTGYLGLKGMFYPDFISWTRPFYSFLINISHLITHDVFKAAQQITFINGIVGIVVSCFYIKNVFSSKFAGLIASLLIALSFNHIVWGSFILTETTGVTVMLIFLWCLFTNLFRKSKFLNPQDLITGILLGCAILTRYEYAILILPMCYLITKSSPNSLHKITSILLSLFITLLIVYIQFFPPIPFNMIVAQFSNFLKILVAICIGYLIIFLVPKLFNIRFKIFSALWKQNITLILFWIISLIVALNYSAFKDFFITDFMLGLFSFFGINLMLKSSKYKSYAYFVVLSFMTLGSFYYITNSDMQRYITHLIPFLLLPASFGFLQIFQIVKSNKTKVVRAMIILTLIFIVGFQTKTSYSGVKNWSNGAYYGSNYEETAAKILVDKKLVSYNNLLISSLPEPYYLITRISTRSISDSVPFVYIDKSLDNKELIIVQDMGMRYVFPVFSSFLDNYLQDRQISVFKTSQPFIYRADIFPENEQVKVYKISLSELRNRIQAR